MSVLVYILSKDPSSIQTNLVKSHFSNPLFDPVVIKVEDTPGITSDQQEYNSVKSALNHAFKTDPGAFSILIKEESATTASPDSIASIVNSAIHTTGWDICYLCKWNDDCSSHSDKMHIAGSTTTIARTYYPSGIQALLFSPKGRDILRSEKKLIDGTLFKYTSGSLSDILRNYIAERKIIADVVNPNLFEFDIAFAQSPMDYAKTHECADNSKKDIVPGKDVNNLKSDSEASSKKLSVPLKQGEETQQSCWSGAYIILGIFLLILLIWIFCTLRNR